jgi:hypothetical protein
MTQYYKDLNNEIHFLDNTDFEYLLPEGCIRITDEEAQQTTASIIIPPNYQELRAAEYPPITDYLDGIIKGDIVQQQKYIDDCLAVKEKYPKEVIL